MDLEGFKAGDTFSTGYGLFDSFSLNVVLSITNQNVQKPTNYSKNYCD